MPTAQARYHVPHASSYRSAFLMESQANGYIR
jgi:hypothetical protein